MTTRSVSVALAALLLAASVAGCTGDGAGDDSSSSTTSTSGEPPASVALPGTYVGVDSGAGRFVPPSYGDNEVVNNSAEMDEVVRQLIQVGLDEGVEADAVDAGAGFAQAGGAITVLAAVTVAGVDGPTLEQWYATSLISGPVVSSTTDTTLGDLDASVAELVDRSGNDVWQATAAAPDGTMLLVVSQASSDDAAEALAAMAQRA